MNYNKVSGIIGQEIKLLKIIRHVYFGYSLDK